MNSIILIALIFSSLSWGRNPLPASRFEHLTGMKLNSETKAAWDAKFNRPNFIFGKRPANFLAENYHFLPHDGTVLDVGMGEGRNSVFLAQKGFKVTGVDISSVAIKKAQLLAREYDVKIKTLVASTRDFKTSTLFDAVICFYYVDRNLNEQMKTWLKPGGILIFEAHTLRQKQFPSHSQDPEGHFLKEQELFKFLPGWRVLKFEEPLHEREFRSSIILQEPR